MRVFSGTNINSERGKSAFYAVFILSESILVVDKWSDKNEIKKKMIKD